MGARAGITCLSYITEEGRSLLGLIEKRTIMSVRINPEDEGGSAGVAGSPDPADNNDGEKLPEERIIGQHRSAGVRPKDV